MNDWWLIVATPGGRHVWHIGEADPTYVDELALAARVLTGFPPGNAVLFATAWNIHTAPGTPHHSLLAAVRDPAELVAVDPDLLAEYRQAHEQTCALENDEALLATARDALACMSDAAVARLATHPRIERRPA